MARGEDLILKMGHKNSHIAVANVKLWSRYKALPKTYLHISLLYVFQEFFLVPVKNVKTLPIGLSVQAVYLTIKNCIALNKTKKNKQTGCFYTKTFSVLGLIDLPS